MTKPSKFTFHVHGVRHGMGAKSPIACDGQQSFEFHVSTFETNLSLK